jgi:glycosyltransferase involved in cell wall biosynthesis
MYPKVLIIGQTFNQTSGGGITLTNLFKGWDKNSIAVAAERIINPDTAVCENYYQLGSLEAKRRFPFNLIEKKFKSGSIKILNSYNPKTKNSFKTNNQKYPNLAKLYDLLLHFFGLFHYSRNLKTSNEFLNWINEFKPDIIYTQLASYELIKFVSKLNDITNVPIAIHIMDDWPTTISKSGILQKYWRNKIDNEFRSLLDKTSIFLSISQGMTSEYKKRYNKDFKIYHNPIKIENWDYCPNIELLQNDYFRILYTGRIGVANNQSIIDICRVVYSKLNVMNIELYIYTNDDCNMIDRYLVENRIIKRSFVPHNEMPELLSSYHLLLLPLDFSKRGIEFAKYSFPTKASEYMISGTPILVFAPQETALCIHAKEHRWAYVVDDNNDEQIVRAIENLMTNESLRRALGHTAREFAINNFDAEIVRENFRKVLSLY